MAVGKRNIRLGFAEGVFPEGIHICQIFSDDPERSAAVDAYLLAGLQEGERVGCWSENLEPAALKATLRRHALDMEALEADGQLARLDAQEVYFHEGHFDPAWTLGQITRFHADADQAGRAARLIGEVNKALTWVEGGHRWIEYERGITVLQEHLPISVVCQYDARAFDGATIMDALRVHPMMVVRGEVFHNPFFEPPGALLSR